MQYMLQHDLANSYVMKMGIFQMPWLFYLSFFGKNLHLFGKCTISLVTGATILKIKSIKKKDPFEINIQNYLLP